MDSNKELSTKSTTPLLISIFIREFLAVGLLLLLESRIRGYDYINSALILFLILIAARMPYINSYAYFFETLAMPKWAKTRAHGLKNNASESFNWPFFFTVLVSHIAGSIAAAAARVYLDAQYGIELIPGGGNGTIIHQGLKIDVDSLGDYSSSWFLTDRKKCFADKGVSGQVITMFPIDPNVCVSSYMMYIWYIGEEATYVLLLCICFIHIWLGAGVADEKTPDPKLPPNPFTRGYWKKLFKLSFILTGINMALTRAFPTAHGSLHNTLYNMYYEKWGANVKLLDTDNNEATLRVIGGLVGVVLAYAYSAALANTDANNTDPWTYQMLWGFDPVESTKPTAPPREQTYYARDEQPDGFNDYFSAFGDPSRKPGRVVPQYNEHVMRIPHSLAGAGRR